jgi:hypothetical protein
MLLAQGEVRRTFDDAIWIWLDRNLSTDRRPVVGQTLQVVAACEDTLRLLPCQLVEATRGRSLRVVANGSTC